MSSEDADRLARAHGETWRGAEEETRACITDDGSTRATARVLSNTELRALLERAYRAGRRDVEGRVAGDQRPAYRPFVEPREPSVPVSVLRRVLELRRVGTKNDVGALAMVERLCDAAEQDTETKGPK